VSGAPARCRWLAKGQHGAVADWAGDGIGLATHFDETRAGGAAVLVKFSNGFDAWIPPAELESLNQESQETAS
jgi:hypothetical protein